MNDKFNAASNSKTVDDTLKERGESYGEFITQGYFTQSLKEVLRSGHSWNSMDDDMKEALDMIASKIARLLNGDPAHIDSWHDIQGYARLVEKRLTEVQEEEEALDKVFSIDTAVEDIVNDFDRRSAIVPNWGPGHPHFDSFKRPIHLKGNPVVFPGFAEEFPAAPLYDMNTGREAAHGGYSETLQTEWPEGKL